jgi:ribonucleoside-diphosphate reductase beta chain
MTSEPITQLPVDPVAEAKMDPLFVESPDRFVLFPIQYNDVWQLYKEQLSAIWVREEINLIDDEKDFDSLSKDEQHVLKMVLAFFASSDGIVNENLICRFANEVKVPEWRCFYALQMMIENVHNEVYSSLIDTLVKDAASKKLLFEASERIPCVARKAAWAKKWISSNASFAERLVAFACVEGIFFSASFSVIFYYKKRNLMPGLTFANELISADEAGHTKGAYLLYSQLQEQLSQDVIHNIVREAVEIETEFVDEVLNMPVIGLCASDMKQYVCFVADRLCRSLGCDKIYNKTNPLDFMELISLRGKTNFFERKVGEYKKFSSKHLHAHHVEFNNDEAF